ncbi:YkvA family protein [Roseibium limicola]|uniref:DUF1232 domain-containing protein n=1 Tax=Roseibium limicola TaxID=2816037 RepID=A0A939EL39_9HYPH|nr:YkvA family protein [Roseibium limicola]MBO0344458.1 DUF1232 domain-containing protein [Roseibium limicola]
MTWNLRQWARAIKRDIVALYGASRDPRVPWHAKAMALVVTGYALSPIDLIPDFIPVLGYLDDIILLPLGIYLVVKLIPPKLMAEHRAHADAGARLPSNRKAAVVVVTVWIVSLGATLWVLLPLFLP